MANTNELLTLQQIADWRTSHPSGAIIASPPSLQRGLVWEVQQLELLWDSIFRGFPIGSLVLSDKIANQGNKGPSVGASVTHHILDGQQRCYAIALGFENPWTNKVDDDSVLWIDINPDGRLKGSSRKYLFRVTTKAHPWGFGHDEQSSRLSYAQIREFLKEFGTTVDAGGVIKRPLPEKAKPYDAGLPIPVGLLLNNFDRVTGTIGWDSIAHACDKNIPGQDYIEKIAATTKACPDFIAKEVRTALDTQLVALMVPNITDVDDIGQIFKRLNSQGTPIDPEELAYSMIKTYWPEIEGILSGVPKHVPEARLTRMAVRAALTKGHDVRLQADIDANRIRNIFHPNSQSQEDKDKQADIKQYVGSSTKAGKLKEALEWIDKELLQSDGRSFGLPSYLRSSLAWSSPDVFVWLLILANTNDFAPINDATAKRILGLALSIHWFGLDKSMAINYLMKAKIDCKSFPKDFSLERMNIDSQGRQLIATPLKVDALKDLLPLDAHTNQRYFEAWRTFWDGIVKYDPATGDELKSEQDIARKKRDYPFIERLKSNRELLVYVQREYFHNAFSDFDPSNRLMWKGHNRPWDYDHILSSNALYGTGKSDLCGDYHEICKSWQQSVGNLVAVDLSFNRSVGDDKASNKYGSGKADHLFGKIPGDLSAFDIELKQTKDIVPSMAYVAAARNRLVSLYEEWYNNLLIAELLN